MKRAVTAIFVSAVWFFGAQLGAALAQGGTNGPAHALAMHGDPKYAVDFTHFDYVNPDAPKGGTVVWAAVGSSYDTLNPFIVAGVAASGSTSMYDTMMVSSADEAFTKYCLLCETVEVPEDRSWVEFVLHEDATWHDGEPVTVDDVIYTFELLTTQGQPFYRYYYSDVARVEQTGERSVRYSFSGGTNLELPLIVAELPVLPKHYWEGRDFSSTTLEPPLGSGSYRVQQLSAGSSISYERVDDYWARDLPVNAGRNNFDVISYEYFLDPTVAREAFKGGSIDLRVENQSKAWATSYDVPAVADGRIIKEEAAHNRSAGMQGFLFNTRLEKFADPSVREALGYGFDFEFTNKDLFYGAYTRTDSYFDNSELASSGLLADADQEEREILERYRGQLPDAVFDRAYTVPVTSGEAGGARENLAKGSELLTEAGWILRDGKRYQAETDRPLTLQILLVSPDFERVVLPFINNLQRMGVDASVRLVDPSQYTARLDAFDFDVIVNSYGQSLSPGNEQRDYWGSASANAPGSRNYAGISDPVIDELTELLIRAPSRESLIARTRALDRALLWGFYVIPNWHVPHDRIAYWDKFGQPDIVPAQGVQFSTWWVDEAKAQTLQAGGDGTGDGDGANGEDSDTTRNILIAGLAAIVLLLIFRRRRRAGAS